MDSQPLPQAAHTRVPNIISDWVKPLLSSAERDCLDYIMRRTIGWADANGGRKARDTIALEQFENGQTVGNYLRDLGTGLTRGTIKTALKGLEDKGLVDVRYSCLTCLWEQQPGEPAPEKEDKKGLQCPRCRATLSRSWALATFTPRKVIELLNAHDKHKRTWHWDRDRRMPYFDPPAEETQRKKQTEADLRDEAVRLYKLLWFKELVEQCVKLAEGQLKAGRKVTMRRRINGFYKPVLALQEEYNNPPLLKFALEQTIEGPPLRQPETQSWHKYLAKVAKNNAHRFGTPSHVQDTNAAKDHAESLPAREQAVRELLQSAYQANKTGDFEAARSLLSDILAQVKSLAELFDGDEQRCDASLREAFKQGSTDFVSVRPSKFAAVDYYAEWQWPEGVAGN